MTTIVDYGAGNIRSVQNTLEKIGANFEVTNDPNKVRSARRLILPGVGHFGQMMRAIDELNLRQPILEKINSGIPFLGICVGLQCLFEGSEESPGSQGLGVFRGSVKRFHGDARIPHMGWNSLTSTRESPLLTGLGAQPFAYFAHSYYAPVGNETAVTCTYMNTFSAVIQSNNVHAVQFHPEKSGPLGLRVMQNFLDL